jgi:L-asparagine transporter-like permease
MSPWTLYWITTLDRIQALLICGISTTIILVLGYIIITCMHMDMEQHNLSPEEKAAISTKMKKMGIYGWFITIVLSIILTFLPSTKSMAFIYIIPKVVNNETIQTEASEIYDLAKTYLKKQLESEVIKPEKEDD